CPSCSPGWGKYRLGWELNSSRVTCWQCGKRDAPVMISQLCRIKFSDALGIWKNVLSKNCFQSEEPKTGRLVIPSSVSGRLPDQHQNYLKSRGFDPMTIVNKWEVGAFSIHSKLSWRLYIPIFDNKGRQVSWTTRSISDDVKAKYITAG